MNELVGNIVISISVTLLVTMVWFLILNSCLAVPFYAVLIGAIFHTLICAYSIHLWEE